MVRLLFLVTLITKVQKLLLLRLELVLYHLAQFRSDCRRLTHMVRLDRAGGD